MAPRRGPCWLGALLLIAALPSLAHAQADELLFVRGPDFSAFNPVEPGDQFLIDRLEAQGYTVDVVHQIVLSPLDVVDKAVVVISETVEPGVVNFFLSPIDQVAVPIVCLEPLLYESLSLTGPVSYPAIPIPPTPPEIQDGDYGTGPRHDQVFVADPGHPLAGGLSAGFHPVASAAIPIVFGFPAAGAEVVVTLDDPASPTVPPWWQQTFDPLPPLNQRAGVFVYEAGATLVSGAPAAARRVGLCFRSEEAPSLSAEGLALFDAAVAYSGSFKLSAGGNWSDPSIWLPPGLPTAADVVIITADTNLDTAGLAREVGISPGATLASSGGSLSIAGDLSLRDATCRIAAGDTVTVGDDLLLGDGGALELSGTLQVLGDFTGHVGSACAITGGTLELGGDPFRILGMLQVSGGTIRNAGAARIDVQLEGDVTIAGLTWRGGDTAGLVFTTEANILRLRDVDFDDIAPTPDARFLSIEAIALNLSAPGCRFGAVNVGLNQHNVQLVDVAGIAEDVILNLEDRGTNGAGAGEAFELELGSHINWVYACPDNTAGEAVGFPQAAFDLNTFALYAIYAAFRDVDGAGTDRIYAFDAAGQGIDLGYAFDVPAALGDIVGLPWWDTLNSGAHVVWVTTSTGRLLRFRDTGPGSDPAPELNEAIADLFTTPPISDGVRVFAAGFRGGTPRLHSMSVFSGQEDWNLGLPVPVHTELATERSFTSGSTKIYAGSEGIPGSEVTVLDEDFSGGAGGFSFAYAAGDPDFVEGFHVPGGGQAGDGSLRVRLGFDPSDGSLTQHMAGLWAGDVTIPADVTRVTLEIVQRLRIRSHCATDEFIAGIGSYDTTFFDSDPDFPGLGFIAGPGGGTGFETGPWETLRAELPRDGGVHTVSLGAYAFQRNHVDEWAELDIDSIRVIVSNVAGRVYRIDAQTRLIEAENRSAFNTIVGAPFPVFGEGLFIGDQDGVILGIDHASLDMDSLPNWPHTLGTGLIGSVWYDFFGSPPGIYAGDIAGQIFAMDVDGNVLPGYPVQPFTGTVVPGGGIVDGRALWMGNSDGQLVAIDVDDPDTIISPGATYYRLGDDLEISRPSQEFTNGRLMISHQGGKVLVFDRVAP